MSDLREAAEMALEALEQTPTANKLFDPESYEKQKDAIDALRQALAQPEQETKRDGDSEFLAGVEWAAKAIESKPPKRKWVGLTEEERDNIINQAYDDYYARKVSDTDLEIIKNTDAKLKEKNA